MNELQGINYTLGHGNEKIYSDLLRELKAGENIDDAFKLAEYNKRVKTNFSNAIFSSMESATLGTIVSVDEKKAVDWYLFTNHDGGPLSDNLRTSGVKQAIKDELNTHFQFKTSVSRLQKTLPVGQKGALPSEVQRMMDLYKSGSATSYEVEQSIKRVRKYTISNGLDKAGSSELAKQYASLARAVELNDATMISHAYEHAVNKKIAYINERIARTETARAYNMSRNRAYEEDPQVDAWRWLLSPAHPVVDVCDHYADANDYNLGPGVYPVGDGPSVPAHPNCLCLSEPVVLRTNQKEKFSQTKANKNIEATEKKMKYPNQLEKQLRANKETPRDILPKGLVTVERPNQE